ncbi:MAG: hypothetical protein GW949_07050 [Spirochaetales bacterium]|nr:hypothetical protein [Spirochaetales bacterium]
MKSLRFSVSLFFLLIFGVLTSCVTGSITISENDGVTVALETGSRSNQNTPPRASAPPENDNNNARAAVENAQSERRVTVPLGNFGTVLEGARPVTGLETLNNPGLRLRLTSEGLVVNVSLVSDLAPGTRVIPQNLSTSRPFTEMGITLSRDERLAFDRQLNAQLQVDRVPGQTLVLQLPDNDNRILTLVGSALQIPSFVVFLLGQAAEGRDIRVAVLPSEFSIPSNSPELQNLFPPESREAFIDRTILVLEDLARLGGAGIVDRTEVNRVLLQTDLSVSEVFSTEGILQVGSRVRADYALAFGTQVLGTAQAPILDLTVRLIKVPEGEVRALYRERLE